MFCVFGIFWNHLRRRAELSKDEKTPRGRNLERGYRAVERTAGDITSLERFEDSASI